MDQHSILIIKLVVVADEQLIAIVMHLMLIGDRNFLDRVEKGYDVSQLDEVQQSKGELLHLKRDSRFSI
jgi:hypothetical protein